MSISTGSLSGGEHSLPLRVYYEDTDAGGVVYHANYLRYFERARTELLVLLGIGAVAELAEAGAAYVVHEVEIRYSRPARLGDILTIVTSAEKVRASRCVVKHRVIRDGQELVTARITLALIGADGRPRPHPSHWIEAFGAVMGAEQAE